MEKLEKAKMCLRFYANRCHWDANYPDSVYCMNGWEMAQECLKEIER